MKNLKIKVCGMRDIDNIEAIRATGVDLMGLIFFDKSKRYVLSNQAFRENENVSVFAAKGVKNIPAFAGVFVNASIPYIQKQTAKFQLTYAQLHGEESPEYCRDLSRELPELKLIKVFSVGETFNFAQTEAYAPYVDLFLFDTKGKERGGNGVKFNWEILQAYRGDKPFMLSGGITLQDAEAIADFEHPRLWGVDINSGFESSPGLKKAKEVKVFGQILQDSR